MFKLGHMRQHQNVQLFIMCVARTTFLSSCICSCITNCANGTLICPCVCVCFWVDAYMCHKFCPRQQMFSMIFMKWYKLNREHICTGVETSKCTKLTQSYQLNALDYRTDFHPFFLWTCFFVFKTKKLDFLLFVCCDTRMRWFINV